MNIKERARRYIRHNRVILFCRLLGETFTEACIQSKHLGASQMLGDKVKFGADLKIRVHAIEKGMSIGTCRPGFGVPKVEALIRDLVLYVTRFPEEDIDEALCVIERYIAYNEAHNADMRLIKEQYDALLSLHGLRNELSVGIVERCKADTLAAQQGDFAQLSASRFSIRDYDPHAVVDEKDILAALDMARKAPSACNRQSAHAHIFKGDKAQALFDYQGGCKGFSQDMRYAVLVTADMRNYFINERHQMYVDGALYAMHLLLSLHYKGLATIPLTTAFKSGMTRRMLKKFDIPAHEVPVMLIGVGGYKEVYKVAVSHRKPLSSYYTMHD